MKPVLPSNDPKIALPLVVKVGGSLFNQIPTLAPVLNSSKRPLFIIPGGGHFADTARQCRIDEDTSHWMAIAAMEQYGWFISSFGIPVTEKLTLCQKTSVFLPYQCLRINDVLSHTWNVTSDTIAAWVAATLGLDLLVLKSVDGIFINGILQPRVTRPVDTDVVDPFFIPFVLKSSVKTTIINGTDPKLVENILKGAGVSGTEIGTTF
jgi:5-(aminomethyl)-3-furanmethanol phosphate kinase